MKRDISVRSDRYVRELYGFGISSVRGFSHSLDPYLSVDRGYSSQSVLNGPATNKNLRTAAKTTTG